MINNNTKEIIPTELAEVENDSTPLAVYNNEYIGVTKRARPEDSLNRDEFIDNVVELVENFAKHNESRSFAIDGKWGVGKTYVVEEIENRLSTNHLVIHYNAWENDYYQEPLLSILTVFADELNKQMNSLTLEDAVVANKKALIKILKAGAKIASKKVVGFDIIDLINDVNETLKGTDRMIGYDIGENVGLSPIVERVRSAIAAVSETVTIIFVVDELDRCLPEYSIKVLERLHHVFNDIDNLQLIISVDKDQLVCTIQNIFGVNRDIDGYLKKFIDFELKLDEGVLSNKFNEQIASYKNLFEINGQNSSITKFITKLFDGIEMRTRLNLISKAELIHRTYFSEIKDKGCLYFELFLITLVQNYKVNILESSKWTSADMLLNSDGLFASSDKSVCLSSVMTDYFIEKMQLAVNNRRGNSTNWGERTGIYFNTTDVEDPLIYILLSIQRIVGKYISENFKQSEYNLSFILNGAGDRGEYDYIVDYANKFYDKINFIK